MEDFKNFVLPLPPLEEQSEIKEYINELTEKFKKITTEFVEEIRIIKEYRESLISAAVTGKIDLRNYHLTPEKYVETANH